MMPTIPKFALADWYTNPADHRCPHDAWLESITISEPAEGERSEVRQTRIVVRLLGAYHDGHIEYEYTGVTKYIMTAPDCRKGLGDWIEDNVVVVKDRLCHAISWRVGAAPEQTLWFIEADDIAYRWIPKNAQ